MCSPRTMIQIAIGAGLALALGYYFVPGMRTVIVTLAPFALFAICPVTMLISMAFMNKGGHSGCHGEHAEKKK